MNWKVLAIACVLCAGCNDRTRTVSPTSPVEQPDLGVVTDATYDEPVRGLCVPGSRRCLTDNSPLYEQCARAGQSFDRGACEDGHVCREGSCVPFSCVPGRALCVGSSTTAVCDESGTAVADPTSCEDPTVCVGGSCIDPCEAARAARSYITCEYTAHELPNLHQDLQSAEPAPFAVVVANPATLVNARVTIRDGEEIARLRTPFHLSPSAAYQVGEGTDLQSEVLTNGGPAIPIESAADVEIPPGAAGVFLLQGGPVYQVRSSRPVVAYQFSPYCCNFTATNDASLLLPSSSWGKRYRLLGYPAWRLDQRDAWSQAYVSVLSDVDTTVRVTSPVELRGDNGTEGTEFEFALAAGEPVLLYTSVETSDEPSSPKSDLTGAVVEADDPIGVFTGHPCTFVPEDQWACDHLEESLLPAEILGKRYLLTPLRRRSTHETGDVEFDVREATYWRIVADEDAVLTFSPPLDELAKIAPSHRSSPDCHDLFDGAAVTLRAGEYCELGATQPASLSSTGALQVGGVISGHQSTGVRYYGTQAGDPSLFILPPVEQFRTEYAFVSPKTFRRTYVTVAAAPAVPVTLDGRSIPQEQRLERHTLQLGTTAWEMFTIALEPGVHAMSATTRFGIVAYAYDDYVSYAFTGGLDLLPKGAR